MTTDYAWPPADITVSDVLDRLRLQVPDRETIYYVYVVGEQRKVLGVVALRDLIWCHAGYPSRRHELPIQKSLDQESGLAKVAEWKKFQ